MIPINYHHLYYFWTVAKCGSIASAKDRLFLSQPTLSAQLQELEEHCKAKLLNRSRKGVSLTAEGQTVFEYCERIFIPGEELVELLSKGFEGPSVLRVGVETTISRDVVVRVLDFTRRLNKRMRIAIFNAEPEVLTSKLKSHALDFVIANNDLSNPLGRDFMARLVRSIPVYFVASPTVKKSIRDFPGDLSRIPMLLRPPENPVRKQVDEYFRKHKIFSPIEAAVDDADLIRSLAIEGRGAAAMNALSIHQALKTNRLVKLHKRPVGIEENIWFICSSHPKPNQSLKAMIDALMSEFIIYDHHRNYR